MGIFSGLDIGGFKDPYNENNDNIISDLNYNIDDYLKGNLGVKNKIEILARKIDRVNLRNIREALYQYSSQVSGRDKFKVYELVALFHNINNPHHVEPEITYTNSRQEDISEEYDEGEIITTGYANNNGEIIQAHYENEGNFNIYGRITKKVMTLGSGLNGENKTFHIEKSSVINLGNGEFDIILYLSRKVGAIGRQNDTENIRLSFIGNGQVIIQTDRGTTKTRIRNGEINVRFKNAEYNLVLDRNNSLGRGPQYIPIPVPVPTPMPGYPYNNFHERRRHRNQERMYQERRERPRNQEPLIIRPDSPRHERRERPRVDGFQNQRPRHGGERDFRQQRNFGPQYQRNGR